MFRQTYLSFALLFAAAVSTIAPTTVVAQSPDADEQTQLVAVLNSDAEVFEKAKACQRLGSLGDKSAVPALAELLPDEKLSGYARTALERIPDPAAAAALRRALDVLQSDRLIGVMHSLGRRRDSEAVSRLSEFLDSEDEAVFSAAARAVSEISTEQAADQLRDKFAIAEKQRRAVLGEALLRCAQLTPARRVALCDLVRQADVPESLRRAATYDAIVARGESDNELLAVQLDSDDDATFRMALQAARKIGRAAAETLQARFAKQKPERQVLLLIVLAELGDEGGLALVRQAAQSGDDEVRVQALRVLPSFEGADVAAVLLDAAVDKNPRVAEAARLALVEVDGETVDFQIIRMLGADDPAVVAAGIDLAERRNVAAAARRLLKLTASENKELRLAALRSVGSSVSMADFEAFLEVALAASGPEEKEAARAALQSACRRLPQDAAAVGLGRAMAKAPTDDKITLLEQLAYLGGPQALAIVATTARDQDDALVDAATRVLGEWLTADAAKPLLELAKTSTAAKYQLRTLRGSLRIARQLDMPLDERMQVCRQALAIADRDDERILALEVLSRYPAVEGLTLARTLLENEKLRERSCDAIVNIAERLDDDHGEEITTALAVVVDATRRQAVADRARQRIELLRAQQR